MKRIKSLFVLLCLVLCMTFTIPARAEGGNSENPGFDGNSENPGLTGNSENPGFTVVVVNGCTIVVPIG